MARQSSKRMTPHILESRELDVTGLSKDDLRARTTRNTTKLAAVSLWLQDSIAWMEAAVVMDGLSGRSRLKREMDYHRANVAHVATGYAYELLMKSIAKADDIKVKPVHSVKEAFAKLGEARKQEIRKAVAKHGVQDAEGHLSYVDERMCHKDRKYWMFGKDMRSAGGRGFFIADGVLAINGLARIHQEIVDIGWRALEEWRKIYSKEYAAISRA